MPSVDGQLAAWLKADALFAINSPVEVVAWTGGDRTVEAEFVSPIDARVDAALEAARTGRLLGGPNVKDRLTVKGLRRDLLFKCVEVNFGRAGYSTDSGPELVINGNFNTDTSGWAGDNATLSQVGGRLRVTATSSSAPNGLQVRSDLVFGKLYQFSAQQFLGNTTDKARLTLGGSAIDPDPVFDYATFGGFVSHYFVALGSALQMNCQVGSATAYGVAGNYAEFDNISLRQVLTRVFVIGVAENENNTTTLTVIRRLR